MNFHKRFLTGIASGIGSVGIKTILNIVLIPVFIKMLGLTFYSLYVLLMGVLDFSQILDLGFAGALVKTLSAKQDKFGAQDTQSLLKISHLFYLVVSMLALIMGIILIPFIIHLFHIAPALVSITHQAFIILFLEGALTLYTCYYRAVLWAHCLHQWTNVAETLFNIISNLAGLILLLSGYGLIAVLWARLFAAVLRTVILIVQAVRVEADVLMPKAPFNVQTFKNVMSLTWNALLIRLSVQISHKIDTFVIAAFLPLPMVGVYEITFRFLSLVSQLADKIAEVILPFYGRLLSLGNVEKIQTFFLRISNFLNVFACLLLLNIVWFFPKLLFIFSAGKIAFSQTVLVLIVALPFVWSGVLQYPANYYLFSCGKERFLAFSSIITAVSNLFLSLVLVQYFGIVGVALGTLVPQFYQHQFSLIRQALKSLNISVFQYLWRVHVQGIIPILISWLVLFCMSPLVGRYGISDLIIFAVIAVCSVASGGFVWLFLNTTPLERKTVLSGKWGELQ